jgi:hypothetical protein
MRIFLSNNFNDLSEHFEAQTLTYPFYIARMLVNSMGYGMQSIAQKTRRATMDYRKWLEGLHSPKIQMLLKEKQLKGDRKKYAEAVLARREKERANFLAIMAGA